MSLILIFGFGSLINKESLLATVPNAKNLKPALINGFKRSFSLWDSIGFNETNLDVGGIPYCAVDVIPSKNDLVNGVVFSMTKEYFNALCEREQDYDLVETEAFDFESKESLGNVFVFSANKNNGVFDEENNSAQERYLKICLDGAKYFGNEFYTMFLETTYIGNKNLKLFLKN